MCAYLFLYVACYLDCYCIYEKWREKKKQFHWHNPLSTKFYRFPKNEQLAFDFSCVTFMCEISPTQKSQN